MVVSKGLGPLKIMSPEFSTFLEKIDFSFLFQGALTNFKLQVNNVIETIPKWPKEWFVKLKIIVHSFPGSSDIT